MMNLEKPATDDLTAAIERERQAHDFFQKKDFKKAVECLRQVDYPEKNAPSAALLLARSLYHLQRAPEAVTIVETLLKERPNDGNYLISLSLYLRAVGDFDASERALRDVPPDMPGYALLRGWHMMREGKFLEGFSVLEKEIGIWRAEAQFPLPEEKRLKRNAELGGTTVLLILEGGYGDEVAYARIARLLSLRGARVIAAASLRLQGLIGRIEGVSETRALKDVSAVQYDYYLPSMSAVALLGIEDPSDSVRFPYLSALPEHVAHWKPHVEAARGGNPAIGIHWQGNWDFDYLEAKSPPADKMLALGEAGKLFSLQRDAGKNRLPSASDVIDTESGMPSWERTVAITSLMDYIVTNDTAIAHIAGALGKKTLVIVPLAPHHYYLPLSGKSIWYPTVCVFRQKTYGDWSGAIQEAKDFIRSDTNA